MSEVYAVPINREWSAVSFDHEFLNVLRARNMEVEIEELYTVGTLRHGSEDSTSYVMAEVSHLKAPLDTVDVVEADRTTSFCCGCPGWSNHCYDEQIGAPVDECKHIERLKQKQGHADENQATLV